MKPAITNLAFLLFLALYHNFCEGCIQSEKETLLKFKQDVNDPSQYLASWGTGDGDCCTWIGIGCNNLTGHIHKLDLRRAEFRSPIPDGLQNLTSLRSLDLSGNNFSSSIPSWIYKFNHLESLSLENCSLQGTISSELGSLTAIRYLSLSYNGLEGRIPRSLSRLCNLETVLMEHVKLSQEISEVLDIFSGCASYKLFWLSLSFSRFYGQFTDQLGEFKNLDFLDISSNNISGPIPSSLGKLSSLRVLDLSDNNLNGNLTQIHFANLTSLSSLSFSRNSLMLKVSPNWFPPFQLTTLRLASCHIGPRLPSWLYSQNSLTYLDVSNSGIEDSISNEFWNFLFQFDYINLSNNQIYGVIPNFTQVIRLKSLDLSSNNLSGPLPLISSNMLELDLSNNSLSGSIFQFLCNGGMNQVNNLVILNLEDNLLSGELPDCWMNWKSLSVLSLGNNKFTGNLPTSIGKLTSLRSLNLWRNNFSGTIPVSLQNCPLLTALDAGENEFDGDVLRWIGQSLMSLVILNLRSNKFQGPFPVELCHLSSLQILDLAENNLSGSIPRCINNFSAMVTMDYSGNNFISYPSYSAGKYVEDSLLVMKARAVEYKTNLNLLRSIDLSKNNFSGVIPMEVTDLGALRSLNVSYNFLQGKIPENIGAMRQLEAIDFSINQLSGEIPLTISDLTFLSILNLSNNNLIGRIPSGTQLQSFDASCFTGNELCGSPLPKKCNVNVPVPDGEAEGENGNEDEVDWFYVSMALGFVVGFCSLILPLLVNRRWRFMYSQFLDRLAVKFVVAVKKFR